MRYLLLFILVIWLISLAGCESLTPATVAQLNEVKVDVKHGAVLTHELSSSIDPESVITTKLGIHANSLTEIATPSIFDAIGGEIISLALLALTGGAGRIAHVQHKKKVAEAGNLHPEEFNKSS